MLRVSPLSSLVKKKSRDLGAFFFGSLRKAWEKTLQLDVTTNTWVEAAMRGPGLMCEVSGYKAAPYC